MNNTTSLGGLGGLLPQASAFLVPLCPELAAPATESWAFHASHSAAFILLYFLADLAAKKSLPDANARWFALHAAANALVVAVGARDVAAFFASPLCAMLSAHSSWVPSHLAFALHAYHLVAFTSLRGEDIGRVPLADAVRQLKLVPESRYDDAAAFFG